MSDSEKFITSKILRKISTLPRITIFRNNVGVCMAAGRRIVYGLTPGSSDFIGWVKTTITQDMVGKDFAMFLAVEVKTKAGKLSAKQKNFIEQVNKSGGVGIVARGEDDIVFEDKENQ